MVGLIAGLIATFLLSWHPIQWLYEKGTLWRYQDITRYTYVFKQQHKTKILTLRKTYLYQSLKLDAIKNLKDKLAALIYFFIILATLTYLLADVRFITAVGIGQYHNLLHLQITILFMVPGVAYFIFRQSREFVQSARLGAIYFQLFHEWLGNKSAIVHQIKALIDLGDWNLVKDEIDYALYVYWYSLDDHFTRTIDRQ